MATVNSNPLVLAGALLVIAGIAGLTIPVFSTHQMANVAKIGDLKVQAQETTDHTIPQVLAGAVIVIGAALAGIGLARKPT
jgi:ABC-type nickel/cobalt efflux system permease component RcnA